LLDNEELLYRTYSLLDAVAAGGGDIAGETPVCRREPGWPWSRVDREHHMNLFEHPLWEELEERWGMRHATFAQCHVLVGGDYQKYSFKDWGWGLWIQFGKECYERRW
jgi:hypothetical protein